MLLLSLAALAALSAAALTLIGSKILRIVLSVLMGVFFVLQCSSVYVQGALINHTWRQHAAPSDVMLMAGMFRRQIAIGIACLVFVPAALYFAGTIIRGCIRRKPALQAANAAMIILCGALLALPRQSMLRGVKEIYDIYAAPLPDIKLEDKFEILLTQKQNLQASCAGKNIIILSLESFEYAYLHPANRHLTPNMQKRKEEWRFYEMQPNEGSAPTLMSLYTVFTGIPYIDNKGMLSLAAKNRLVSLANILNICKYQVYFCAFAPTFSGTDKILKQLDVRNIIDVKLGDYKDKEVFEAGKKFLRTRKDTAPFMLWISTLQPHNPGYSDSRLLNVVGRKATDIENAIAQDDYLTEKFLSFLEDNGYLENTIVYMFPDHLYAGYVTDVISRSGEPRRLWMMTNADSADLKVNTSNFYQIDLAPAILRGAKVQHNAKFLADLIDGDKGQFISANKGMISAINANAVRSDTGGYAFYFENDTLIVRTNTLMYKAFVNADKRKNGMLIALDKNIIDIATPNFYGYFNVVAEVNFDSGINNLSLLNPWTGAKLVVDGTKIMEQDIKEIYKQDSVLPVKRLAAPPAVNAEQIYEYLGKILKDPYKLVLVSVANGCGKRFGSLHPMLTKSGAAAALQEKFQFSYLAAFSARKVYANKAADATLAKYLNINGMSCYLASGGCNNGWFSRIIIDGEDYSYGRDGMNVVVLDTRNNKVFDAFYIDVFGDYLNDIYPYKLSLSLIKNKLSVSFKRKWFSHNLAALGDSILLIGLNSENRYVFDQTILAADYESGISYGGCHTLIKITPRGSRFDLEWSGNNGKAYRRRNVSAITFDEGDMQKITTDLVSAIERGEAKTPPPVPADNLPEYLRQILQDTARVVVMSVMDDGSAGIEKIRSIYDTTGLELFEDRFRWSYIAVFSGSRIYYQKMSPDHQLRKTLKIAGMTVSIQSGGWNTGGFANSIVVEGKEYSLMRRGLNIVIIDTNEKRVIDAIDSDFFDGNENLNIKR